MVIGGDSCPEGMGFESQHRILDVIKVKRGWMLDQKYAKSHCIQMT